MALPCGHRAGKLPQSQRIDRVTAGGCPICPAPSPEGVGVTARLRRWPETCRACALSSGACGCCGVHWVISEGEAREVIAPVRHPADAPGRLRP
jgi:hypothetical protein